MSGQTKTHLNFIGGKWVTPSTGATVPSLNPDNRHETVGFVADPGVVLEVIPRYTGFKMPDSVENAVFRACINVW